MGRYTINGQNIRALRRSFSVGRTELAGAIDLSPDELKEIEGAEETKLSLGRLERLSEIFGQSVFAFAKADPSVLVREIDLVDFRTERNRPAKVSVDTWKRINWVHEFKADLEDIFEDAEELRPEVSLDQIRMSDDPDEVGSALRRRLKLQWDYQTDEDKPLAFLSFLRTRIEQQGAFVVQVSYPLEDSRGFCLCADRDSAQVIAINRTLSNLGARAFTLLHETAHLMLGKQGISDFTVTRNEIESFCNSVAASALMPRDELRSLVRPHLTGRMLPFEDLQELSALIGVSQYSLAIRLKELDFVAPNYVSKWLSHLSRPARNRFEEGDLDPEEVPEPHHRRSNAGTQRLAEIGVGAVSLALAAYDQNIRGEVDLYRTFKIKPAHFDVVRKSLSRRTTAVRRAT